MRENSFYELKHKLEESFKKVSDEVGENPPKGIFNVHLNALKNEIGKMKYLLETKKDNDEIRKINLAEGPDKASTKKISNIFIHPIEWLNIGWKAAGTVTAIPTFGIWSALGFLLIIRDILKMSEVKLSLAQGMVLHVLGSKEAYGNKRLSIEEIIDEIYNSFSVRYNKNLIYPILEELERLKCISSNLFSDKYWLNEEIRL